MMIARRYMKLQFHLLRCLYLNTNETYKEWKMAHIVKNMFGRGEKNERVFSKRYRFMSFLRLVVHDYVRGVSDIRDFKEGQVEGV